MATAKEGVQKILEKIPDNATYEDIQYHIYVKEKVERGLKDIQEGQILDEAEIEKRMSQWLEK